MKYQTFESVRQGMGRRAADLTTPVPVLGVPALAGVRGWRTTVGDRVGGALLQTWGPHCSVGVQTSPGIIRPPTELSVQLTDTLSTPSDKITQASSSYITKETEYREILLLTKSDKEKRAILKQKSGEAKTKKEVTFRALGEASKDVTCSQRSSSGTYCYARAIKTNPHFAGTVTSVRPKLKPSARYTNGSVVDSEAIGGISLDSDEAESVRSGRNQTKPQGHYAEQSGKSLLLSATRPFGLPQKICGHCGGRQSVANTVVALGEKGSTADACLGEKGLNSLSTCTQFQMPHKLHEISDSITNRDKRTHITVNPHLLYLSEELKYRKTPHPACPVHSRNNLVTLSQAHAASDTTQPTTILHAKTITVTKATIETRQDDPRTKPSQEGKIPRPTTLALTPQMATATKPNNPHSNTYPLKTLQQQHTVPQNVCVSVHATPENTLSLPSNLYTTESITNMHNTTINTALMSTESIPAKAAKHETLHSTRVSVASNTTNSAGRTLKCPTVSLAANASDPIHKLEATAHPIPQASPDPGHKMQENPSSNTDSKPQIETSVIDTAGFPTFDTTAHTTTPHFNLNHNSNSDQMTHTSTKNTTAPSQIKPEYSNSEPTLHVSTASPNAAPHAAKPQDSRARLLSSAVSSSTSTGSSALYKYIALRNSSVNLKNSPPTAAASSSTLTGDQRNACSSGTASLQPADTTRHSGELGHNEAILACQRSQTQAADNRTKTVNKSVVSHQGNDSATAPAALPELINVSEHRDRGSDPSGPKSTIIPNTDKFNGNLINKLVVYESKQHENSNPSQVTGLQNYISLIESNSSCLQGCINTEQQRLAHYQGYTEAEREGQRAACPPVKTAQEAGANREKFAMGTSARHANIKLKSSADEPTRLNNPTKKNSEPIISSLENTVHTTTAESSSPQYLDTSSLPQAHTSPELSFTPASSNNKGELCPHASQECNSILPSSTMHLASLPRLQPCDTQAIVRPDSKFSPARPQQPCPEDTSLAHSHPADAALLLPPSPQCCKSAALQQRLETVEANLAANKDRITTLLNIIHDLETCHTPSSG